ncbi:MAG: GlcG/HbpS family heme-binding protein [Xanthobacteraceae bacterium]|jgi:glc operon protein GlcG
MPNVLLKSLVAFTAVMLSAAAYAQQPPAATPPATPPSPTATPSAAPPPPPPYGTPITLDQAKKAVEAAVEESKKNNWGMNIAVVGPSGDLVHFSRMDTAQFASIKISQHKARTAATFRRPTKVFQDGLAANPANVYLLTLDDVIASEGGIPIVVDGKMVGAIGCSGGTGQQDGQACQAGVNALK